ncbi:MAG: hypothetical protein O7B99_12435 [Planctomycetota bacterium]|nr:hypothetical protein [Planctomycetota bacterium]
MKGVVRKTCLVTVLAAFPVVSVSLTAGRRLAGVAVPTVAIVIRAAEGEVALVSAIGTRATVATDDPASWKALLPTRSADLLPRLEELYRDEASSRRLQAAIADAVARTAPPREAAAFLLGIADERLYGPLIRLGAREGGPEALQAEYEELVRGNQAPRERRLLVAGLHARPEILARIARTDPDRDVRGQALLTRSAFGEPDWSLLADLERGYRHRDDPEVGIPVGVAVDVAGNVLAQGTGAAGATASLRRETVRFLEEVAADASVPDRDRRSALRTLAR